MLSTSRDHKTTGVGVWRSLCSCPQSGWKLPEDSWGGRCILFFLLKILWFFISTSLKNEPSYHILLIWKELMRKGTHVICIFRLDSFSFILWVQGMERELLARKLLDEWFSRDVSVSNLLSYFIYPWGELLCFVEVRLISCYSFTELMTWYWHSLFRVFSGVALVGLILWLALDTAQRPEQLVSFAGICMFILILFACSKHHSAVSLGYAGWAKDSVLLITKCMCQVLITKA